MPGPVCYVIRNFFFFLFFKFKLLVVREQILKVLITHTFVTVVIDVNES